MTDREILSLIGAMVGTIIIGVNQDSLDRIMNKTSKELGIVVKDASANLTVDDLEGRYFLDKDLPVNIRAYEVTLSDKQIVRLKDILKNFKTK